jgi:hypothetical protein
MKRRTRAATRRRRKDALGALLIGGVLAALGGLAAAAASLRTPPYDPQSLCRTDAASPAHTLILIDATDRLDARHVRTLQTALADEVARLPRWGRLSVLALDPDAQSTPRTVFSACTPGDRRSANPLWENVKALEQAKAERFDAPLARAATKTRRSNAAGSPIVEGLSAAAREPGFARAANKRLVLVSDLLQHDPQGFSLYAEGDWPAYRASPNALRTPPDLSDVDVRIVALERPNQAEAQARALETFWPAYFADAEARSLAIDR